jgi:KDO2-lipid IV(A) lauroyltransferase
VRELLYRALGGLGLCLDARRAAVLGEIMGWGGWRLMPRRRRHMLETIATRLSVCDRDARRIARASFTHSMRSYLEIFCNRRFDPRFLAERVMIDDPKRVAELDAETRPVVFTAGHLGSWELLAGWSEVVWPRHPRLIVVRRPRDKELHRLMLRLRTRPGLQVLEHREAAPRVMRFLRRQPGAQACFLVDHNCSRREAAFLPFLGRVAAVNKGPAVLAVRSNAIIQPVFLVREPDCRYRLLLGDALNTGLLTGSREERILEATRHYTMETERYVRTYPDQWYWIHRRWKTRPPEDLNDCSML